MGLSEKIARTYQRLVARGIPAFAGDGKHYCGFGVAVAEA
jgi:hypothetical protein